MTQNDQTEIVPIKRGRGRPKTGTAMTGAERTRRYREQLRQLGVQRMINVTKTVTENTQSAEIEALRAELEQLRYENDRLREVLERPVKKNVVRSEMLEYMKRDLVRLSKLQTFTKRIGFFGRFQGRGWQ